MIFFLLTKQMSDKSGFISIRVAGLIVSRFTATGPRNRERDTENGSIESKRKMRKSFLV